MLKTFGTARMLTRFCDPYRPNRRESYHNSQTETVDQEALRIYRERFFGTFGARGPELDGSRLRYYDVSSSYPRAMLEDAPRKR